MTDAGTTLLTGASSGLGAEIARHLSRERRLILTGRDLERLERTRNACANPEEHLVWPMDLGKVESIELELTALLTERGLTVNSFVHCAGMLKIARLRSLPFDVAVQTMNVNFMSAVSIVRTLLGPRPNKQQLRNVVFISSTASQFGARGFNMYCASKGALDALMRALAVELAPNVRVNSVLPGGVRTEMTASMFENQEMKERIERDYPLGIGEPDDIASAVAFLLSEKSRWITGQQMVVDGGRTVNITA